MAQFRQAELAGTAVQCHSWLGYALGYAQKFIAGCQGWFGWHQGVVMSRSGKSMGFDPKGCMLGLRRAAYKATCTIYCRRRTIRSGYCRRRRRAPKRRPARCSSGSGELRLLTRDRPGACGAMRAAGSYPAGSRCCLAGPATAHRFSAGAESRFGVLPKRCIVATFCPALHRIQGLPEIVNCNSNALPQGVQWFSAFFGVHGP